MKNVVIAGANRGLGLALTKLFSRDHFVHALCRGEFPTEALNETIQVVKFDVTSEAQIKKLASKIEQNKGVIDLLINNAAVLGDDGKENVLVDAKTLNDVFATNTAAPMLMCINLAEALKRAPSPAMIAISSGMGTHAKLDDYNAEWWPYSASKCALSFAVSALAINEPRIKSVSVHPGWVKTVMGGEGAEMEPEESAEAIKKLYENMANLESGRLYNYDGTLLDW